jgi:hypothetical protein
LRVKVQLTYWLPWRLFPKISAYLTERINGLRQEGRTGGGFATGCLLSPFRGRNARRNQMLRLITLTLLAGAMYAQDCRTVPVSDGSVEGVNAPDIAAKLNKITDQTTVIAVGANKLLVCTDAKTLPLILRAVPALSEPTGAQAQPPASHSVRLFFNRNASDIATALDNVYSKLGVKSVGKDLLVFGSSDPMDEPNIRELKRWIATLDTPRPLVTLNAWSVQASSPSPEDIRNVAEAVRTIVFEYNEELRAALDRGLSFLNSKRFSESFGARWFTSYILKEFVKGTPQDSIGNPAKPTCGDETYCLGYGEAFLRVQPSLSNMIGLLAAANFLGNQNAYQDAFVDCMEGRESVDCWGDGRARPASRHYRFGSENYLLYPAAEAVRDAKKTNPLVARFRDRCEAEDERVYSESASNAPAFSCFRQQLKRSLEPPKLVLLRTAIADYLFQYKYALRYPHDFEGYDYTASAQQLDAQLDPLLTAFNQDMVVFLRHMQAELLRPKKWHGLQFASNGIVSVTTISGNDGAVNTGTQSAFAATPAPLAQDFLKNLSTANSTPGVLKSNLPPNAADALAAFLNSSQPVRVVVGRDLNLDVTPVTLPGAGSAELSVTLEAKDDGSPSQVSNGAPQGDTTDRVTNHKVTTTVRVDTLKLFEVSTFSAELAHGRDPIPMVPPFVQLPYVGSFLNLKRGPSKAYHQSFAIISATILPTAADLLNGLKFQVDKAIPSHKTEPEPIYAEETDIHALADKISKFHKRILSCIAWEANPGDPELYKEGADKCPTEPRANEPVAAAGATPAAR